MTKETAADYLPLVQALADGKTVQVAFADIWEDRNTIEFTRPSRDYRIKPEPWLVPYTYEDDIIGMVIIPKNGTIKLGITGQDRREILTVVGKISYDVLRELYTHLDGSPCGRVKT